jgi:5'(3')-deoxyribonucleotidase
MDKKLSLNIGIDVDLTLVNPIPLWVGYLKANSYNWLAGIDEQIKTDPETGAAYYPADTLPYALPKLFTRIRNDCNPFAFWDGRHIYDDLQVYSVAKDVIRRWVADGHNVFFISYCMDSGNHVQSKINMLRREFDFIPATDFNFIDSKHKSNYRRLFDVMIDDRMEHLNGMGNIAARILFETPYGEQKEASNNYYSAADWYDVEQMVDAVIRNWVD